MQEETGTRPNARTGVVFPTQHGSGLNKTLFLDNNVFDIFDNIRLDTPLSHCTYLSVRSPASFSTVLRRAFFLACSVILLPAVLTLAVFLAACDQGFAPPDDPPTGTLVVDITYENYPETWPATEDIYELLFVALRFVPKDTADFLQLNRLIFSERLQFHVERQTVTLDSVGTGLYPYAGVAHKYSPDLFAWRPIGLVEEGGGVIVIEDGKTTRISMSADFLNPPPFPPPETP